MFGCVFGLFEPLMVTLSEVLSHAHDEVVLYTIFAVALPAVRSRRLRYNTLHCPFPYSACVAVARPRYRNGRLIL